MWKSELDRAIRHAGSQTKLAAKLSELMGRRISPQLVSYWMTTAQELDPDYCLPIQYLTAGTVKASAFQPRVYPAAIFDDLPADKILESLGSPEPLARVAT